MDTEKDIDVEKDLNMDTEKDVDTEIDIPRSNLYENRLTLVHLSRKINSKMLDEMKEYFLEKDNSVSADDLSNVTSIKLISLMEDKEIISMKNCTELQRILDKIKPSLKEELSRKCKYFFSVTPLKCIICWEGSYKQLGHSRGIQLDLYLSLFFYLCLIM